MSRPRVGPTCDLNGPSKSKGGTASTGGLVEVVGETRRVVLLRNLEGSTRVTCRFKLFVANFGEGPDGTSGRSDFVEQQNFDFLVLLLLRYRTEPRESRRECRLDVHEVGGRPKDPRLPTVERSEPSPGEFGSVKQGSEKWTEGPSSPGRS